jgi:hypothetical protein
LDLRLIFSAISDLFQAETRQEFGEKRELTERQEHTAIAALIPCRRLGESHP